MSPFSVSPYQQVATTLQLYMPLSTTSAVSAHDWLPVSLVWKPNSLSISGIADAHCTVTSRVAASTDGLFGGRFVGMGVKMKAKMKMHLLVWRGHRNRKKATQRLCRHWARRQGGNKEPMTNHSLLVQLQTLRKKKKQANRKIARLLVKEKRRTTEHYNEMHIVRRRSKTLKMFLLVKAISHLLKFLQRGKWSFWHVLLTCA